MKEEKIQMMEIETRKIIVNTKSINNNKSRISYLNMGKVIYLGFLFLLFLSVYNSLQNMITLLYKQFGYDRLATFTMLSLFFVRGLSNLIGPLLTYIYLYNRLFLACSLSILPLLIAGKLTSECSDNNVKEEKKCSEILLFGFHIISAICLGFFLAILWATQSCYVNEASNPQNKGRFFGVFWSFVAGSQILGNSLTIFIFRSAGSSQLFNMYIILVLVCSILFVFVRKPTPQPSQEIEMSEEIQNENVISNKAYETTIVSKESKIDLFRFIHFFKNAKIKFYFPLFMLQGYAFTLFISIQGILIFNSLNEGSPTEKDQKVGIVFLVFGAAEILAGQIFGHMFDKFRKYILVLYCIINYMCIFFMYLAYLMNSYVLFIITAIFFAFSDIGGETLVCSLLSIKFMEKIEPFVVFRCLSTLMATFVVLMYFFFSDIDPLIMVVGVYATITTLTWLYKDEII